jgi:hypothetical protein
MTPLGKLADVPSARWRVARDLARLAADVVGSRFRGQTVCLLPNLLRRKI